MASKIIKLLETTDTVLGVHRNYVFLSKKSQFFCKLRVLGELMLCIIFAKFLFDGFVVYTKIYLTFEIFSFISSFNALFILLSSIITSSTYKCFIENLLVVDSQYRFDLNYIKKSKKLVKTIYIKIVLSCIVYATVLTTKIIFKLYLERKHYSTDELFSLFCAVLTESRFILRHVVVYGYITMIKNLLESLNYSILDAQVKYRRKQKKLHSNSVKEDDQISMEQIVIWATQFQCLLNCSRNASICFKVQVIFI